MRIGQGNSMTAQIAAHRHLVKDYVTLTKPRIVVLLCLTALGGLFLASDGAPELLLSLIVLGGGAMAAGGAQALNHYLERDTDAMMLRTRNRPVASGRVAPSHAMAFGVLLNIISFVALWALVNPLAAILTLSATIFYVLVYTVGLKRRTSQNIVIGGAAGAIPPMVGWVAVTGSIDLPAIYLFAIIFFWTPPHFWALSLLIKDDYALANIPMLPVVSSLQETKKQIMLYSILLVGLTTMFFTTQAVGWVYFTASTVLGILFLVYAWRLMQQPGIIGARPLYLYSLLYLALLFVSVGVDSVIFG